MKEVPSITDLVQIALRKPAGLMARSIVIGGRGKVDDLIRGSVGCDELPFVFVDPDLQDAKDKKEDQGSSPKRATVGCPPSPNSPRRRVFSALPTALGLYTNRLQPPESFRVGVDD